VACKCCGECEAWNVIAQSSTPPRPSSGLSLMKENRCLRYLTISAQTATPPTQAASQMQVRGEEVVEDKMSQFSSRMWWASVYWPTMVVSWCASMNVPKCAMRLWIQGRQCAEVDVQEARCADGVKPARKLRRATSALMLASECCSKCSRCCVS
jgi:hypothetical protein